MRTNCVFHPVWDAAARALAAVLGGVTFEELARKHASAGSAMYYI